MVTATFADLVITTWCDACRQSGFYHYARDGALVRTARTCYRCGGKGYQSPEDVRRNWGYDQWRAA
jgi:DnaJ-class molecular chaperone